MTTFRRILLSLAFVSVGAAVAATCPVCLDASNPTVIEEYRRSTMFLSLLPFGIVGSIVGAAAYLARRPVGDAALSAR